MAVSASTLADRLRGRQTTLLQRVSEIAAHYATDLETIDHRETCELAAHGLLFASGHPDPSLAFFVDERNRVARFKTMRNFAMAREEADREIQSILSSSATRSEIPSDDLSPYLRQFSFHVTPAMASLYFIGSTSGALVSTKAFAMIALACGKVGKELPRPVPSYAMATALSFVYPELVSSGIIRVRDALHLTDMADGATDVDRTQLILSWITPVIEPGERALPSAAAHQARHKVKTEAGLIYAFFVVAALRTVEFADALLHDRMPR